MCRYATTALVFLLAIACSASGRQPAPPAPSDVVATVGGVSITLAQVDQKALQEPASNFGDVTLAEATYEARRAAANEIVANILLDQEAKRWSVDRAALYQQEVTSKVKPVDDQEVSAWYAANPDRVQGAPLDKVRGPILSLLKQMHAQEAREAYLGTLKAKTPVRLSLEPPRAQVAAGNSPAKGAANAPIELIEFADFQCPYCRAVSPTVTKILNTYGDRIRFVYRNFPLDIHPDAKPAAEAAQCANEQGRFWPYHDRLFSTPNQPLSVADLKHAATMIGLDADRFNTCVDAHKYRAVVDADTRAGTEAGVTGTPAFFINGRLLSGAQPYEAFKRLIDEELELKKR